MTSYNQTVPCAGPEALIPCCQPTNYGAAAAFRFNLPDCRRGGEQNEYVIFVVPRIKEDPPPRAPPRRPCPTRCTPRPQCVDYDPPDGCVQHTYISVAGAPQQRACGREPPAAQSRSSCDFNRWSTEYRSTIGECARWVLDSDVRCKRKPIYPIQCLVESPCRDEAQPDEEQCTDSRSTFCAVPSASYQRTCQPVSFKQEVVAPYPTRAPADRSLPCPKPTITTSTPTSAGPTSRTNPPSSSRATKKQMTASPTATRQATASPTTTRQITASPTTTRRITASPTTIRQITTVPMVTRRRSPPPQQLDQQCDEDPHCCASPTAQRSQMVGTRRPLPRCKMQDSQDCI